MDVIGFKHKFKNLTLKISRASEKETPFPDVFIAHKNFRVTQLSDRVLAFMYLGNAVGARSRLRAKYVRCKTKNILTNKARLMSARDSQLYES